MFKMSPFWEKFFYIFTYITQGSSYLTPRAYAVLHRMHHAYSDTEKDPHSPHHTENLLTMMWTTKNIYNEILKGPTKPDERFTKDLPEWKLIDKLGDQWLSRVAWGLIYIGFYVAFATQWWMFLLLPIHFLMSPVHGAIVNWCGHKYGYSNFDNNDKSKNTFVFDLLMCGELFQNNHHKFGDRPKFAVRWYEFDPTYPVMKVLHLVGIIKIKPPLTPNPKDQLLKKKKATSQQGKLAQAS